MSSSVLSLPKSRYGRPPVSAAGVLCIIGGTLGFLSSAVILLTSPAFSRVLQLLVGGLLLVMGVLGIVTGWGLLRRQWWAQVAAIMWAVTLVTPAVPLPTNLGGWIGELIFSGIGIWWLFLFIGGAADEEFGDSHARLKRPPAVTAVAWLLLIDTLSFPLVWMLDTPTFFFGHSIPATYSKLISLNVCVLAFLLGLALLKRSKVGFWLTVAVQAFYFASSLVTDLTPRALSEINSQISDLLVKWHITGFPATGRTLSFVEPGVITLLLLLSWHRYREPMSSPTVTNPITS